MGDDVLELRFLDDNDGTGKLLARVSVSGFAGHSGAYVGVDQVATFAKAIAAFPVPADPRPSLVGGFWKKDRSNELEQEHLGIVVYPIDHRGHIGVQVRLADESWNRSRPEAQCRVQVEIITRYEPLRRFSAQLLALVGGTRTDAVLEGKVLP
jgi:hypothetical protein